MGQSDAKLEKTTFEKTGTQGRGAELCEKTIITEAANIKAAPGKLYWLLVTNAKDSKRHFTLHDATSGSASAAVVQKIYMGSESTQLFNFDPPMPFATGIRVGSIEVSDITMVGGYI